MPKELRDKIWAAYVEGQEITKTPSKEYLEVAGEADVYARFYESQRRPCAAPVVAPQSSLF